MKNNKIFNVRIFLMIAATLIISGNILAQQQQDRNPPPKIPAETEVNKMVDELSVKLSLSKSQKQKVSDLFTAHFNEAIGSMNNNQKKVGREEMEKKRRNFEDQIKSLLKDDQKIEFDEFMKNHGPQPNQHRPKR